MENKICQVVNQGRIEWMQEPFMPALPRKVVSKTNRLGVMVWRDGRELVHSAPSRIGQSVTIGVV